MWLMGPFLDIGNIIFFVASLGQMIRSYRNRTNLGSLSSVMLLGYIIASFFFVACGFISGGYITTVLGSSNIAFWLLSLYWKRKHGKKELRVKGKRFGRLVCILKLKHKWGYYVGCWNQFCLRCGKQRDKD